jgi:RNA polymerase sigma-70 factor (ECF subfamily)
MNHRMDGQGTDRGVRRALAGLLPELRAFARFLAGSRAEADDLVQEALLRTLRAAEEGRLPAALEEGGAGALRPWCLSVIRNVFHEGLRARRREAAHRAAGVIAAEAAPPPVPQDGRGEVRDLARALATLPPLLREALVLVGARGLSHEEAAAVCGVPVGTMKARVSRARRQLSGLVDQAAAAERTADARAAE